MTTTYLTIMMKHFEQMQIDVAAASETILDHASLNRKETAYDCNRFLFIKEGEGQLLVRGDAFPLAQGKFFILLAGIPHRIALEPGQSVKLQWCHFRASYEDRDLYRTLHLPFHTHIREIEHISLIFERLIGQLAYEKLTSRLRIKAAMLELISIFFESLPIDFRNEAPTQDLKKIEAVMKYVDEHLAENIAVEDMAKQVYLHPNYFIVFFKGILGCSPIQYVNQRRMEMAKKLLLQPECNVSAVAGKVGMQIYYFSRMFKAHTGLTPSRYRKQGIVAASDSTEPAEGERQS